MSPSIARARRVSRDQTPDGGGARRTAPVLYVLALVAIAAETVGAVLWLRWRFSRHEVCGESMQPALREGDWIIVDRKAYARALPRRGDIVLARDPREPSRQLVKRIDHVDLHGNAWLLGDNAEASTDSRTFGAVPRSEIVGRVIRRYWPLRG